MTKRRLFSRSIAIAMLVLAPVTIADDFTIDWHTIDGGGGTSQVGQVVDLPLPSWPLEQEG